MSAPFQESILRLLTNGGAMTARQLAEETERTIQTTVYSLCRLRKKHLVFQPQKGFWTVVDADEYIAWKENRWAPL